MRFDLGILRGQNKHNFGLLEVQEVKLPKGGTEPKVIIYLSMRKGMEIISYGQTLPYVREAYKQFRG
jgi:hypothetical protein